MKVSVVCFGLALALGARVVRAQQNAEDPSAGGLAPPPALSPEPEVSPPTRTEQELRAAEREDSGRGLAFFWANAEAGYELLGLRTFHDGGLGKLSEPTLRGPVFGGALGARLIALTLGARFRFAQFADSSRWSVGLEGGYHIPIGRLEPYVTLGGGYTSLAGFKVGTQLVSGSDVLDEHWAKLRVHGFDLRATAGLDYYFASSVSVGANLSGELLFLSRSRLKGMDASVPELAAYTHGGSSIGGGAALTALVGLHF